MNKSRKDAAAYLVLHKFDVRSIKEHVSQGPQVLERILELSETLLVELDRLCGIKRFGLSDPRSVTPQTASPEIIVRRLEKQKVRRLENTDFSLVSHSNEELYLS